MSSKVVVVTGGAGYIGGHACKALALAGYSPVAYDNLVHGHRWAVRWGPFEYGDIGDRARLDEVMGKYRPAAIMHFAAFAYVGESVISPGKYYRNNVAGALTLLEAARDHGVEHFVFSSTCATYGVPETSPIPESHPQCPINPYGSSKLMVERILDDFSHAHGLKYVVLRYFNAAGADPAGEIGEVHEPETHVIPIILDVAMARRPAVTIFGDDYKTADGTCIRDYVHVSDLADAHVLSLQRLQSGGGNSVYNLGNGRGHSVRELIDTTSVVTGRKINAIVGQRRPGDPPSLVGDAQRAVADLGWKPALADLAQIIETAWKWHSNQPVQHILTRE